jgi:hypothetical protein
VTLLKLARDLSRVRVSELHLRHVAKATAKLQKTGTRSQLDLRDVVVVGGVKLDAHPRAIPNEGISMMTLGETPGAGVLLLRANRRSSSSPYFGSNRQLATL